MSEDIELFFFHFVLITFSLPFLFGRCVESDILAYLVTLMFVQLYLFLCLMLLLCEHVRLSCVINYLLTYLLTYLLELSRLCPLYSHDNGYDTQLTHFYADIGLLRH